MMPKGWMRIYNTDGGLTYAEAKLPTNYFFVSQLESIQEVPVDVMVTRDIMTIVGLYHDVIEALIRLNAINNFGVR